MTARTDSLPDRRAVGLPDVPYSAYCRVCWYPVYRFWVEEDHKGVCMYGCSTAADCPEAKNRAYNVATMTKLREQGLVK
jgi:hypothetical protein